jgi:hypothetical protein
MKITATRYRWRVYRKKTSENKPNIKILISSVQINVVSVMGWKSSVILKMKLTATEYNKIVKKEIIPYRTS